MNDQAQLPESTAPLAPQASVERRPRFNVVWTIPIVAALIAGYLGYRAIAERGPTITLTFESADGLVAGQTQVRHKAVPLGTVRSVDLSRDMKHVDVRVQMRSEADRVLTDQARFWVVRARFNPGNFSGLETLVSGAYIELDPGNPSGKRQTAFQGLENPPAVRSDEPGRTFTLTAESIGQLTPGSPIFFRDLPAGEVIGYQLDPNGRRVTVQAFVREPFDNFVYSNTRFWNASGVSLELGANGVQVHLASLQALIAGGIAFDVSERESPGEVAKADTRFQLYPDHNAAASAGYRNQIPFVSYVEGSVRGLAVGAPVELYGIQLGEVTKVELLFDPSGANTRVAVHMRIQPERIMQQAQIGDQKPIDIAHTLVDHGLRVQLQTSSFLTGQLLVNLAIVDHPPPATVTMNGDEIVLPSVPGGLDSIETGVTDLVNKLSRLPLDDIARNLDDTLRGTSQFANGPELKQTLASIAATMTGLQSFVRDAQAGLAPTFKRLPEIADNLQTAADHASKLLGSVDQGYGSNSQFRREMDRLLDQVSETARSVQLFADYLNRHPDALVFGRKGP